MAFGGRGNRCETFAAWHVCIILIAVYDELFVRDASTAGGDAAR
jgi:hypothetical protein